MPGSPHPDPSAPISGKQAAEPVTDQKPLVIEPETRETPVTVVVQPRTIVMFSVTSQELDALASGYRSVHLALVGMALAGAVGFGSALFSVDLGDKAFATFAALFALSLLTVVYSALRAFSDWRDTANEISRIKAERTQPP